VIPREQPHKQVPAKVTALVDEGIKDLVEILNTFDGVRTFESCQGYSGDLASIYADYGEECRKPFEDGNHLDSLTHFVNKLVKSVRKYGVMNNVDMSVTWMGTRGFPVIHITIPRNNIDEVAKIISLAHAKFECDKLGKPITKRQEGRNL